MTAPSINFLQFGPPESLPADTRHYIRGLWLTDEATEFMIRCAEMAHHQYDATRLKHDPDENGHRLVVWLERKFDGPTIYMEHDFVRLRSPYYVEGVGQEHNSSASYAFRPHVGTELHRLCSGILNAITAPDDKTGSLRVTALYTTLAGYFEPAPIYKEYLERFAPPIYYPELPEQQAKPQGVICDTTTRRDHVSRLFTMTQLEQIALVLENEQGFYAAYDFKQHHSPGAARDVIRTMARKHRASFDLTVGSLVLEEEEKWRHDREILRRYFDDRYEIRPADRERDTTARGRELSLHVLPRLFFERDPKPTPPTQAEFNADEDARANNLINDLKGLPIMNTTAILEVTTKTLVNGTDVSTMRDSEIYDLIATQETEIERLSAIKNKPKKLTADEIEKRQAGIAALVTHLDSK